MAGRNTSSPSLLSLTWPAQMCPSTTICAMALGFSTHCCFNRNWLRALHAYVEQTKKPSTILQYSVQNIMHQTGQIVLGFCLIRAGCGSAMPILTFPSMNFINFIWQRRVVANHGFDVALITVEANFDMNMNAAKTSSTVREREKN